MRSTRLLEAKKGLSLWEKREGGNVRGVPRGGLYARAWGERGALNNVGADGLIERARSIRPSVNISAANLHWMLIKRSFWTMKEGYTSKQYDHPHQCAQS